MRRAAEKLKSHSGATILFALLVFMLCILAGTGALTAAAANSGRYTHLKADQQQYLSVSSAAKLLKSELSGKTFTAKARVEEKEDTTGTITRTVEWAASTGDNPSYDSDNLKALLIDQFKKLFEYGVCSNFAGIITSANANFTVETSKSEFEKTYTIDAGDAGKVTAKLTMGTDATSTDPLTSKDFIITIELNEGQKYASTLTLVATFASGAGENGLNSTQISSTTAGGTTTTVTEYTMEVQWLEDNARVTVPEPTSTTGG